jgi:hypothetical protein
MLGLWETACTADFVYGTREEGTAAIRFPLTVAEIIFAATMPLAFNKATARQPRAQ